MYRILTALVLVLFGAASIAQPFQSGLPQEEGSDAEEHTPPSPNEYSGTGLVIGNTHQGELLSTHPMMNDDTHADCFQLEATEGREYTITLSSDDFDSYLLVGVGFCQDVLLQFENDDFEDGNLDAQITFKADYPFYSVYVNTFEPEATGAYSLHVDEQ